MNSWQPLSTRGRSSHAGGTGEREHALGFWTTVGRTRTRAGRSSWGGACVPVLPKTSGALEHSLGRLRERSQPTAPRRGRIEGLSHRSEHRCVTCGFRKEQQEVGNGLGLQHRQCGYHDFSPLRPTSQRGSSTLIAFLAPWRFRCLPSPRTCRSPPSHFFFVLAVVVSTSVGGQVAGLAAAVLSFLSLNYFFTPPLHTLEVADLVDRPVVFLAVSVISPLDEDRKRAERRELELRVMNRLMTSLLSGEPMETREIDFVAQR